jgi:hypothetical protein
MGNKEKKNIINIFLVLPENDCLSTGKGALGFEFSTILLMLTKSVFGSFP